MSRRESLTMKRSMILLALLAPTLTAQDAARQLSNGYFDNDAAGGTMIAIDSSAEGSVIESSGGTSTAFDLTVGISTPQDLCALSGTDFLVVGDTQIERWSRTGSSYPLADSVTHSGGVLYGITYDATDSMLYLLDGEANVILRGSWHPSATLASYTPATWATTAQVPGLEYADQHYLRFLSAGSITASDEVFLVSYQSAPSDQTGFLLGTGTVPTNNPDAFYAGDGLLPISVTRTVAIDERSLSEGGSTLQVDGLPNTLFDVVNTTNNNVVGTGQTGSAGTVSVTLSTPIAIGNLYAVAPVSGSHVIGDEVIAARRYGSPHKFTNGATLDRMFVPRAAHIDSPGFKVRLGVSFSGTLATDWTIDGWMGVGFRDGSVDPVSFNGTDWILQAEGLISATGVLLASDPDSGLVSSGLSIPNDPGLIGTVMFVQFALADGSSLRLSEVVGFELAG